MEIVLDWPTLLDGRRPLQLIANRLVIRTHGSDTVVKIERYVFKTRSQQDFWRNKKNREALEGRSSHPCF
jgi:hypothetical protein